MTQSMTGFARCEAETSYGLLAWEARSVNHRHLDLSLRLPEEFRTLDGGIRDLIAAKIRRGKVDVALHLRRQDAPDAAIELDEGILGQVVEALQQVARTIGNAAPPNPMEVLRWPGVIREATSDQTGLHDAAMELLGRMLEDLVAGRSREGERIATVILERAAEITTIAQSVKKRLPEVQQAVRAKLIARIEDMGIEADSGRLEQELAIIAQRLDVAEEIDRLQAHADELRAVMQRDEPVGRRLDFLLQEFNREANTLGSKSQDAETTRAAVDLKVLIEQIREQVQNLE